MFPQDFILKVIFDSHDKDFQTALLATHKNGSDTAYAYTYDDNRNITSITRGTTSVAYQYNGANELIRENNGSPIRR